MLPSQCTNRKKYRGVFIPKSRQQQKFHSSLDPCNKTATADKTYCANPLQIPIDMFQAHAGRGRSRDAGAVSVTQFTARLAKT
ncbi:hypothetical protein [Burkholderia glumae]|uniref:hypothetical protein n=1 Tax=Burkholderia glumae TaxID=337 RepID=UPI0012974F4C|nr:hypothetical protein [Burkholderia glumae]MCR1768351.1 hypothetical protein [Burkholderia glumae]NVE25496.1 hypothetical protein [Burkholderia glumae]QGA39557.1 hypothetical protein GAS19_18080 [Burkholderia glumae]QHP93211.1 hypothetical protein EXE55_19955 [Burkholderia glumae]